MVQLMLKGFGGDRRNGKRFVQRDTSGDVYDVECYHVNNRLSDRLEDIGEFRGGKVVVLLAHCLEAIWCRYRYGVKNLYYIPAPGKKTALYRDWVVMLLCRPFFKRIVLHWHAAGLGKWLETSVQMPTRSMTYRRAKRADLSVVLSHYNMADAQKLFPQRISVVSNGIPDPCPDFVETILPRRKSRFAIRARLLAGEIIDEQELQKQGNPQIVRVLYLAHCMKEKGLFDAVHGIVIANRILAERKSQVRFKLVAAGAFVSDEDKQEFNQVMSDPEFARAVDPVGFVSGDAKAKAFREADLFCFPTYYLGENQPVNIIEALAYGLPLVTTRWRSLPEMLPENHPGLVPIRSPRDVGKALLELMARESGEHLRDLFLERFTLEKHLSALATALKRIEDGSAEVKLSPVSQPC